MRIHPQVVSWLAVVGSWWSGLRGWREQSRGGSSPLFRTTLESTTYSDWVGSAADPFAPTCRRKCSYLGRPDVLATLILMGVTAGCGGSPTAPLPPTPPVVVVPDPPAPKIPELQGTRFLAFGDSITEGEINDDTGYHPLKIEPALAYPTKLGEQLRAQYVTQASTLSVINAGVSGESHQEGVARLTGVMASTKPDAVLILEGVNGLVVSQIPALIVSLRSDIAIARAGGAKQVFLGTLTPATPGSFRGASYVAAIVAANIEIRALAAAENVVLVDVYAAMVGKESTLLGKDGLHPNAAGYETMARTFREAISAKFER
jgi:lysophospholipase L1-like esterase